MQLFQPNHKSKLYLLYLNSLKLENYKSKENQYDFAVFNKKSEYGKSVLHIEKISELENLNILIGEENELLADKNINIKKLENSYIYNLFYNNIN